MVTQLSTSQCVSQPYKSRLITRGRPSKGLRVILPLIFLWSGAVGLWSGTVGAQVSELQVRVAPLSAIDQQFISDQRDRIEALANRIGRNLTGTEERDIETLQRIIDERLIASGDTVTLQAMGVILGDLLAQRLRMDWVVYSDTKGRSRALHYEGTDVFLFPVTMISRRQEAGSQRRVKSIYDEAVTKTLPRLPGGKWFI